MEAPSAWECLTAPSPTTTTTTTLRLSRKCLQQLPHNVYQARGLENLYLEGNVLASLPENLFYQLPNLIWLDLRNNKLTSLPSSIGDHRCLRTLLLEGNPIRKLPVELGNLTSLKAINLRNCPIEFPPDNVLHQGLSAILEFLRKIVKDNQIEQIEPSLQDTGLPTALQKEAQLIIEKYRKSLPRKSVSEIWKNIISKIPTIEKLNLTERSQSSLDFSNVEEQQQFEKLRRELQQDEERNFFTHPINQSRKIWTSGSQQHTYTIPRKKRPYLTGMLPELPAYEVYIHAKQMEEQRLAAIREFKISQEIIEQRRKDLKALKDWREKASSMQEKKLMERREGNILFKNEVLKNAPFATDPDFYPVTRNELQSKQERRKRVVNVPSLKEEETKDKQLELQIQQHIRMMWERRRKQKKTVQEELEVAKRDLEIAEKFRSELAERKNRIPPIDYAFTAFSREPLSNS
ncbi:leucine-rich repeat-containing protein 27 [Callorhinchus milii]|nr:leucine-rich repeat-containing protein 27 [Callorhinchus milii]